MDQYNRILFVCDGGTSRAPMAVGIFRDFTLKRPVEVESRGLVVLFPEPINQKAEAVLISNGVALNDFMSTQLTEEDFTPDTLILTMEYIQREKVLEKYENVIPENHNNTIKRLILIFFRNSICFICKILFMCYHPAFYSTA